MGIDYTTVTELPGSRASREQVERLCHRYYMASKFCAGKDVLEVGCGAGQGLGYFANRARSVIGGDYTENLLVHAQKHYRGRVNLLRLDAHSLPFKDDSFDVIILFEAIYYLDRPEAFLRECRRLLRNGGMLIISSVNREWSDFNPSPFSKRYFSAQELLGLLREHDFRVELFGAFPVETSSTGAIVSLIKRTAVALHIMPRTMKGKEFLKRIFFGKLAPLPAEIEDGMTEYTELAPLSPDSACHQYKIIYAVADTS